MRICAAAWYLVLVLIWAIPVEAQFVSPREAISAQVQGFYRDDRDNRWPDVLDHFWVGKITARWTAPTSNQAWFAARPLDRDSTCAAGMITYSRCRSPWSTTAGRACS